MYRTDLKSRLILGSALASLFALGDAGAAFAAPADNSGQIETVIVTAEKKSEKLQDVPASVTALDASELRSQGLTDIKDYAAQIPGLSLTSTNPGFQQITLRGISTGLAEPGATTAVYVDEAPIGSVNAYTGGSGNTLDLDPADIARVEVLKGPQGTLYGADAMGGMFKYVMQDPDDTTMFGHVTVMGDAVDHSSEGYRASGTINVPLVDDQLALLVNAYDHYEPGYISNVNGSKDDNADRVEGGHAALLWKLNNNVKVKLTAIVQDVLDHGSPDEDVSYPTLQPIYGNLTNFRYFPEYQKESLDLFNATVDGNWGGLDIVSSTTYQRLKTKVQADGTDSYGLLLGSLLHIPDFGVIAHSFEHTERFAQELRASDTAFGGALEYQFGGYFTHENDLNEIPDFQAIFTNTGTTIPLPPLVFADIASQYTEYAAFGNATYHFTDRFDVLAGLRVAEDHQNYAQVYEGLIVGPVPVIFNKSANDSVLNYQVTPEFKIDDDQMLYAKVATGYRPGGPNAVPPSLKLPGVPQTFNPDRLTSYEVGYKATLLNDSLSFDAAVYYTDWSDVQIQTSADGFNFIVNGGSARTEGAELAILYVPVDGLTLGLNGSYIHANLTSPAPAAGGFSGDELPFVPEWSGSLTADYRWNLTSSMVANVGAVLNYIGNRVSDYGGRAPLTVPSYTVLDLHAGVEFKNYEIVLFAKNVSDSRGITALGTESLAPSFNPYGASIIQPRTIGLQLTAKFE
jgi:outer membrane receptor protein involved in Fe transport